MRLSNRIVRNIFKDFLLKKEKCGIDLKKKIFFSIFFNYILNIFIFNNKTAKDILMDKKGDQWGNSDQISLSSKIFDFVFNFLIFVSLKLNLFLL